MRVRIVVEIEGSERRAKTSWHAISPSSAGVRYATTLATRELLDMVRNPRSCAVFARALGFEPPPQPPVQRLAHEWEAE